MSQPNNPPGPSKRSRIAVASLIVLSIAIVAVLVMPGTIVSHDALVVYCAHDSVFSDDVLRRFEEKTGIAVAPVYDTEATKSLGLVERLIREKENPRCDVFWNNQLLGTLALQEQGLLVPYRGDGFARIPDSYKDADGAWIGFAARLRVYIVNTDKMQSTDQAIESALKGDLSRMAMAKPLFGTTLSHYSLLWHVWGPERLKEWHTDVRERGVREVPGNSTVKNLVASGVCDFGWTDTDDYFAAVEEGKPVAMRPIRVDGRSTICIPNTVAIVQGTKRIQEAQLLVDYLVSEETELRLARSRSRQIPLGPVNREELPSEVAGLTKFVDDGYELARLGDARNACLEWLKAEYLE